MRKFFSIALAVASAAGLAGTAQADSANASASATVVAPLDVEPVTNLVFGTFSNPVGSAGTVSVDTAGNRTASGNINLVTSATSAATFSINTDGSLGYNWTATEGDLSDGSNTMELTLTAYSGSGTGDGTVAIGGTIDVDDGQAGGSYSGTITLTAVYS